MTSRIDKVKGLLQQLAAQYLQRHLPEKPLVTVTRTDVSKDLKNATIYISVYPHDEEEMALESARAELSGFREYAGDQMETKNTPFFEIEIDEGEKKRQRIDEILNEE